MGIGWFYDRHPEKRGSTAATGNWPVRCKKYAAVVEEAIMQLVEIQRFAYGYTSGKVTSAGENWLKDSDANWEVGRWGGKLTETEGGWYPAYDVAVRHKIQTGIHTFYVWEWRKLSPHVSEADKVFVAHPWTRIPEVGSAYVITLEGPWAAWMWDEPVTLPEGSNVVQLTKHRRTDRWSCYHTILDAQWSVRVADNWVSEGGFGLFQQGTKAHLYGGNAEDVFKTEVNAAPVATGQYQVDYLNNQIAVYEGSPRPKDVRARYVCGVWPPGFWDPESPYITDVRDFYDALWHFSVKGEDYEEQAGPGAAKLLDYPVMTDTLTLLRLQIQELCEDEMIWRPKDTALGHIAGFHTINTLRGKAFGRQELRSWRGDLSRGAGREIPDGAAGDYGRTWTVCIGEILKVLEQMTQIVVRPVEPVGHLKGLYRYGHGSDDVFETAKAEAYDGYIADSWHETDDMLSIGNCAQTQKPSPEAEGYGCDQGWVEWVEGETEEVRTGRLDFAFDSKYRKPFKMWAGVSGGMWIYFHGVSTFDECSAFEISVYWGDWGVLLKTAPVLPPISCDDPFRIGIGAAYWKDDSATLLWLKSSNEDQNLIPAPPTEWWQYTRKRDCIGLTCPYVPLGYFLVVWPDFTFITPIEEN